MSLLERISGALGFTARAAAPRRMTGRATRDLPLWDQSTRIGSGLKPADISAIIRAADAGDLRRLIDLENESRQKDCHLQGILALSEESIAGLPWRIAPPENATPKEVEANERAESVLRGSTDLPLLISHLAGAVYYSHNVAETVWRKDAGWLVPSAFVRLAPRRFGYRLSDGAFVLRDSTTNWSGVDFRAQWPAGKFVVSRPRVTGDSPHREGTGRVLIWAALFRNWDLTDWLRTAEISWKPWRIGKCNKATATDEEIDALISILDRLASTGSVVLPDSLDLDVEWAGGSGGTKLTHSELFNVLANEMSKAQLGQTESVQASTSSGYAQAKVHDGVRKEIRNARARQVGTDLSRDLVTPLVTMNVDGVRPGRFEFLTEDKVNITDFASAVKTGADAGLRIPANWARSQMGIPHPVDGEEVIGKGAAATPDKSLATRSPR